MTAALRSEPVPDLEWDRIEREILAHIEADAVARRRQSQPTSVARTAARTPIASTRPAGERWRGGHWFGYAAAAAMIALAVQGAARSSSAPQGAHAETRVVDVAAVPIGANGVAHDVAALRAGDVLETGAEAASFELAGVASWVLEPNGRIIVQSIAGADGAHVLRLERGAIHADVVPRDSSEGLVESFAIEVEQTRVAVHGTSFRVTREANGVRVDVEHGAIAVGPSGHVGVTTGHLLIGPSSAIFSLDGGRFARLVAHPEPMPVALLPRDAEPAPSALVGGQVADAARLAPVAAARTAVEARAHTDARAPAPVQENTAAEPPRAPLVTVDGIRSGLAQCYATTYGQTAPSVRLSISSTLRLTLREDGTVQSAIVDPPLKPEFQSCVGRLNVTTGRMDRGPGTVTIPIHFGE